MYINLVTLSNLVNFVVRMTSLILSPKCGENAKTSNPLLVNSTDWPEGNGLLPLSSTLKDLLPYISGFHPSLSLSVWRVLLVLTTHTLPIQLPTWSLPHYSFIPYLLSTLGVPGIVIGSRYIKKH